MEHTYGHKRRNRRGVNDRYLLLVTGTGLLSGTDRVASIADELSWSEADERRIAQVKRQGKFVELVGIDACRGPAARVDSFLEHFHPGDKLGGCEAAVARTVDEGLTEDREIALGVHVVGILLFMFDRHERVVGRVDREDRDRKVDPLGLE